MNLVKKMTIIFLSILTVLGTFIVPVAAASISSYDVSDVKTDLTYVRKPNGEAFNFDDYPCEYGRNPELISVNEYGYSADPNQVDNYSLYLYIYTGGNIDFEGISYFSFEASNDNQTKFKTFTYELEFIDVSDDGYFAKYKFKIPDVVYEFFKGSTKRYYKITKLDFCYRYESINGNEFKDLTLDYKYCFSGEKKNKVVQMQNSQLISLDLQESVYKTKTSPTGKNYQKAIYTCYFSVPNEYFEQYEALTGIRCSWEEKKTDFLLFTDDSDVCSDINSNVLFNPEMLWDIYNSEAPTVMFGNFSHNTYSAFSELITADYGYNVPEYKYSYVVKTSYSVLNKMKRPLKSVFLVNDLDDFCYKLSKSDISDLWSKGCFTYSKPVTECIFYDTDVLNVESRYNNDRWKQFWDGFLFNVDEFEGQVNTIVKLNDSDLLAYDSGKDADNYDLCKNLLIAEQDIHDFYDYYQKSKLNNETVVLFRFAVRDYYAADAYYSSPTLDRTYEDKLLAVQEVIFDDFDIIWLEFSKDGITYIHPVEAESITISPDVTPPYDRGENFEEGIENIKSSIDDLLNKGREKLDTLLKIFSAVCLVIIFLVFWKPISFVLNKVIEFFKWLFRKRKKNE